MKILAPGAAYSGEFVTSAISGAAANADSLPVATANHNGTDDGSFTLTVTNLDTGRYKVTGTVPSGYAAGDEATISVAATIGDVAAKAVVDTIQVGPIPGNVTQWLGAAPGGAPASLIPANFAVLQISTDGYVSPNFDVFKQTPPFGLWGSGGTLDGAAANGGWYEPYIVGSDLPDYVNLAGTMCAYKVFLDLDPGPGDEQWVIVQGTSKQTPLTNYWRQLADSPVSAASLTKKAFSQAVGTVTGGGFSFVVGPVILGSLPSVDVESIYACDPGEIIVQSAQSAATAALASVVPSPATGSPAAQLNAGATAAGQALQATLANQTSLAAALSALETAISEISVTLPEIDGKTLQQALQYIAAVLCGTNSGVGSGTEHFFGLDGATERVRSTVDPSGTRTVELYDP